MKKKFRKALSEKCADFGLTSKAIDELTEHGSAALKDDASDEDIAAAVDSLVPYAKAMQGEITRKTQGKPSANKPSNKEGEGEGENTNTSTVPEWFKQYQQGIDTRMAALEKENSDLKAEKAANARAKLIADTAKELGIPDFLLAGRTFAEDADIKKELTEFKQKLVNHNLVSKGQSYEAATATEQMDSEEDAWAKSLPDIK